ncbi:uncharacterized protein LOC113214789 isoform X1 [Frankliniella occidentalis]|uniref:Uncharacterized protein LOC113214789 isoform X1 n=2 Tax=Frankliniella occidentalis TaxID=133901 RepID=A0A6J1TB59_FRAOC|nr:uncharacterized protein LOC113214789 isoform X1 [Frankliniella occidentalis]
MSRNFIDTELLCDICFVQFDLNNHRPKSLPCGHTICIECVQNPALGKKCPTCRKDLTADPGSLPDNILAIRMIEKDGAPPRKVARKEDTKMQQLQRGVEAGRKVVQQLREVVPMAVAALNRQLVSSVASLRQIEEAFDKLKQVAAGSEGTTPDLTAEQLQLVAQLEDSLRLLTTNKCSVVAEEGAGVAAWKASVLLGPIDHILRPLLLLLRASGQLTKVDNGAVAVPSAASVAPPRLSTLYIEHKDIDDDGHLKVNDILRNGLRWRNIRTINNLKGRDSEKLLRVMARHVEELKIVGLAGPSLMKEVQKMSSLKKVIVKCDRNLVDYPDLPLQLEELSISFPSENQLRCLRRMPMLRSLMVENYQCPNVFLTPSQHGALLWLGVCLNENHKSTMLSLIRAFAASLQELQIFCGTNEDDFPSFFFPDLGEDLAECSLEALRRLVLNRGSTSECTDGYACLLQRQTIRDVLHSSVDVLCGGCQSSSVLA